MPAEKMYKIVLVEDEKMLLKYMTSSFKNEKMFEVFTATNGEEGEAVIRDKMPDLVLLDIIMPKKNGFEVLESLQKDVTTKKIPVIMLSNLGQKKDIDQAKAMGAIDYWIKVDLSAKDIVSKSKDFLKIV